MIKLIFVSVPGAFRSGIQIEVDGKKQWGGIKVKYFGTDGFRGEANVGLNVVHA